MHRHGYHRRVHRDQGDNDEANRYAQLDITACQAQAAEYHARGFNCAQAVACTLAPAVGSTQTPLPSPRALAPAWAA
ncbi:MAG: hypothetical protein ACLTYW_04915 [Collinsella sp.]